MTKTILAAALLFFSLTTSAMSNPHVVSCGEFLDSTKREFLFEIPVGDNGQFQDFYFSVGWIKNFQHIPIRAKQIKERTGMTSHKIIFTTQDGRFRIEKNKGFLQSDDHWTLNVNLPEVNVSLKNLQISCMGYN